MQCDSIFAITFQNIVARQHAIIDDELVINTLTTVMIARDIVITSSHIFNIEK